MPKEPVQPQDKYVVRFPDGMRDGLKEQAELRKRSLNAEIVHRLADYALLEQEVSRLRAKLTEAEERAAFYEKLATEKPRHAGPHGLEGVLSPGLYSRVAEIAKKRGRSVSEEVVQALETAFPPDPGVHEFYEQWFGALDVARGETRRKMLEEANAEAREYWPDRDIGFHLDGDVVKFSMSKRLTLKSAVFSSEDGAPDGPKRNKVTLSESFRPDDPLPSRKRK